MIIEILYPRLCCLYGDKGNTLFLQQCFPDAEFVFTELNDKPYFLDNEVDLCCLYSMSEQHQELALARLMPYREQLVSFMECRSTLFLLTGNAMELFGKYIQREDGSKIEALGLFDVYAVRHAPNRFNTLLQAEFEDMSLLGYTSRFSDLYGITPELAMSRVSIGCGSDPATKLEGIRTHSVIATYMLGPLLVSNPDFTKWLAEELEHPLPRLPFEAHLYAAYESKRKEFQRSDLELE